jgi:hypothetical protein
MSEGASGGARAHQLLLGFGALSAVADWRRRAAIGSMKNFISMRKGLGGGRSTAEGLIESGTALIGSPRTVLAGIARMRERTGFGILGGTAPARCAPG